MNATKKAMIFSQSRAFQRGFRKTVEFHEDLGKEVDVDAVRLYDLLVPEFDVTVKCNQHQSDILTLLKELDEPLKEDLKGSAPKLEQFIFVFLTFLSKVSEASDGKAFEEMFDCEQSVITLEEIVEEVKKVVCLKGVPKLFLIQADNKALETPRLRSKAVPFEKLKTPTRKIPSDADRLVVLSTIPQALSSKISLQVVSHFLKDTHLTEHGHPVAKPSENALEKKFQKDNNVSMLVEAFCSIVEDYRTDDLFENTPLINGRVSYYIEELKKADEDFKNADLPIPLVISTMTSAFRLDCLKKE